MNPPFVALPLSLVAGLPFEQAYLIWALVQTALLAAVCRLLLGTIGDATPFQRFRVLALALSFGPVWAAVVQGQLSLLLVVALLMSWRSFRSGSPAKGGLWLALLCVKPQLLFLPSTLLLVKRQVRALGGLVLGGTAFLAASLLAVGPRGLYGYLLMLREIPTWGDAYGVHPQAMYTWRGFVHRLLATDDSSRVELWWLLGVGLVIALLLWAWRGPWSASSPRFAAQWALLVSVALFVSPHANFHDVSLLLVPAALAVRYRLAVPSSSWPEQGLLPVLLLGFALLTMRAFVDPLLHAHLAVLLLLVLLLVLAMVARSTNRSATGPASAQTTTDDKRLMHVQSV